MSKKIVFSSAVLSISLLVSNTGLANSYIFDNETDSTFKIEITEVSVKPIFEKLNLPAQPVYGECVTESCSLPPIGKEKTVKDAQSFLKCESYISGRAACSFSGNYFKNADGSRTGQISGNIANLLRQSLQSAFGSPNFVDDDLRVHIDCSGSTCEFNYASVDEFSSRAIATHVGYDFGAVRASLEGAEARKLANIIGQWGAFPGPFNDAAAINVYCSNRDRLFCQIYSFNDGSLPLPFAFKQSTTTGFAAKQLAKFLKGASYRSADGRVSLSCNSQKTACEFSVKE